MVTGGAYVTGRGTAVPSAVTQEELWEGFFRDHYTGRPRAMAERVFRNAGVRRRHTVVDLAAEDPCEWPTGRRMERYTHEALPLGYRAVSAALADAGLATEDVGMLTVASCTGYDTPGLDIRLAGALGLPLDVQRLLVGHMGCYAALPALGSTVDFVRARGRPAVVLCLELASLHLQPPCADPQQIVTHALFGDAAAALVVQPEAGGASRAGVAGLTGVAGGSWMAGGSGMDGASGVTGGAGVAVGSDGRQGRAPHGGPVGVGGESPPVLEWLDVVAHTDRSAEDHMTWRVTDHGFRMGLSEQVPRVLARHVRPVLDRLLGPHGLRPTDVAGWAVHPGGPRVLETVEEVLELPPPALESSRAVLAEYGNCSSPTVLLVVEDLMRRSGRAGDGAPVVMMAFGPGLTLYAGLLRVRRPGHGG